MIPASHHFTDGNDAGGFTSGDMTRRPPVGAVKFDNELILELRNFHKDFCTTVKNWPEDKPDLNTLKKLVTISARLEDKIYSLYRGGKEKDAQKGLALKELSEKVLLAVIGLRNMRDAGGKISPKEEVELLDSLRELDVAIELVVGATES